MTRKQAFESDRLRKGIYLLPNVFTTMNIFFGFFSVILSTRGEFTRAAVLIILAGVFDGLDGKIARATGTTSRFGVEYDSLADLVSFGMAPALMVYYWALAPLGRLGWLAGFLFMVCGALRLARFNTQVGKISSDAFSGLPIPAAAGMCAALVLFFYRIGVRGDDWGLSILILLYLLSFLMVSTVRYHSFKSPEPFRQMNFNYLVRFVLVLMFVAYQPSIALFLIGLTYVLSGPYGAVRKYLGAKNEGAETLETEYQETETR